MILSINDYRDKVLGCWMGKNIGGTLGAPMEWKRQVNDVEFYTQQHDGNPLPNDDLDLQLVWLIALEERGVDLNARTLGDYWHLYITPHWAEYGNGKVNMRSGLMPPLSGNYNNPYKDSCGAFIRSEIWACIAPGCPAVAAGYAYEDAIVDHGGGEGMYAELFCAAVESAAFVEKDAYRLIEIGLSYIPDDCGIARVVRYVMDEYKAGKTWLEARDGILANYRAHYYNWAGISQRDRDMGFADGPEGWDAPANIGFIIIGWLYGQGDFERSLCITVNCGEDTDCTAATLGSIFGIIHGIDAIPAKWSKPIGRGIKTMCLNLGELQGQLPKDIDELTARVERIARQTVLAHCPSLELSDLQETDVSGANLFYQEGTQRVYWHSCGPVYKFDFYEVDVSYHENPHQRNGKKTIGIGITNKYKTAESLNYKWYLDEGWTVTQGRTGKVFIRSWGGRAEFEFDFIHERPDCPAGRAVLELTVDGKHTVMLVPVLL